MTGPDFIDNLNGNTLAQALRAVLGGDTGGDRVAEPVGSPDEVRIATAFFNPTGFAEIAGHLQPVPVVRLLLGADPAARASDQRRLGQTEAAFERQRIRAGLRRMDEALRQERDRLPFNRTSGAALRKLIAALNAGNMEVRRYEKAFLHAKAYVFTPADDEYGRSEGVIAGSSNLTGAGLTRNLELNLGRYGRPIVQKARRWFDELWDDSEPYDLSVVFEETLRPRTPWEVFIRVLWQLYGDEVEDAAAADDNLPLTSFQKHGVARALRLIRNTGGAIVADEVGLGKTFIAGEVLQLYRERRQRALLICPAALRDTTWRKYLTRFQLFAECLSFEELANDVQLRDVRRPHAAQETLQRPLDEYQLVVVDEAHNYRNPDAPTRAAVLRRLLFGRRRDLLLLTATPVNNSLWDLYHLVRFFVRQDARFADRGILSIRERFERAMREDPSSLSPDLLYPVIDATTVKRTRQFVKKHYAGDNITGPDGRPLPIVFPQPRAISVRYHLDDLLPGFFDRLEGALDPDGGNAIAFARYTPDACLLTGSGAGIRARLDGSVGGAGRGSQRPPDLHRRAGGRREPSAVPAHRQFRHAVEPDAAGAAARPHRPHRQPAQPRVHADDLPGRSSRPASQPRTAHPRQAGHDRGERRRGGADRRSGARDAGLHRDAGRDREAAAEDASLYERGGTVGAAQTGEEYQGNRI